MSFFSKLFAPFRGKAPTGSDRYLPIYVFSNRCREPIAGQVDLMNETSLDDETGGYYVRKVLHTSGKNAALARSKWNSGWTARSGSCATKCKAGAG